MKNARLNSTEQLIIQAARQIFIEKGFNEASMGDIAARAGINRPGLHYYFRTKEKLFEAVFADIVYSFVPAIQSVICQEQTVAERIAAVVDIYFDVIRRDPNLPVFMLREIQRDASHLLGTIDKLATGQYIDKIKEVLYQEMEAGRIKYVPLEFIFYTFYGLLSFPFLSRPLTDIVFAEPESVFEERMSEWKEHIVRQMVQLLEC